MADIRMTNPSGYCPCVQTQTSLSAVISPPGIPRVYYAARLDEQYVGFSGPSIVQISRPIGRIDRQLFVSIA